MDNFQLACPLDALAEGSVTPCTIANVDIALYRVDGAVYASEDKCSHGKTPLSDGELDGYEIECPLHNGTFDVRTGAPCALPCIAPIKVFPTQVRNGQLYVAVD